MGAGKGKTRRVQVKSVGSHWSVIPENIEKAIKRIGIKRPILIISRNMEKHLGGYVGYKKRGEKVIGVVYRHPGQTGHTRKSPHVIVLRSNLRSDYTSRVLYHELVHAAQCERFGGEKKFTTRYDQQLADVGISQSQINAGLTAYMLDNYYHWLPLEREAMRAEQRHERLPLCVNRNRHR